MTIEQPHLCCNAHSATALIGNRLAGDRSDKRLKINLKVHYTLA